MRLKALTPFLATLIYCNLSLALDFDTGIKNIIALSKQPIHVGIVIRQADTGKILYNNHGDYLFAPASVQKLLTATAALHHLGPDFTFKTKLLTQGKLKNGTLNGDVLIKFSGDPELTAEDLTKLISALKEKHINTLNGHVFIDTSRYDSLYYPPGWLWEDLSYSYAAPLSAAIINKNSFVLHLTPGKSLGSTPTLEANIPSQIISFSNHVKTTARYDKHCPLTIYSDSNNHYTLSGCLNKNWGKQHRSLAIREPVLYVKKLVQLELHKNNIQYSGKIILGSGTGKYNLLTEHSSAPLATILKDMLKKSDNLISDSLLKQLGHQYFHQPGSWQNGILALRKVLADTKIN